MVKSHGAYVLECDAQRNKIFTDISCDYKEGVYDVINRYHMLGHCTESQGGSSTCIHVAQAIWPIRMLND